MTTKGNDLSFFGDEAYVIAKDTKIQKIMRNAFRKAMWKHSGVGVMSVYKEKNIYNMYVKPKPSTQKGKVAADLCPGELHESGEYRQGIRP